MGNNSLLIEIGIVSKWIHVDAHARRVGGQATQDGCTQQHVMRICDHTSSFPGSTKPKDLQDKILATNRLCREKPLS